MPRAQYWCFVRNLAGDGILVKKGNTVLTKYGIVKQVRVRNAEGKDNEPRNEIKVSS